MAKAEMLLTGPQYPVQRHDHWYEVELGDYLNKELGTGSAELRMSLREVKSGKRKGGLILYGIKIRPKSSKKQIRFRYLRFFKDQGLVVLLNVFILLSKMCSLA